MYPATSVNTTAAYPSLNVLFERIHQVNHEQSRPTWKDRFISALPELAGAALFGVMIIAEMPPLIAAGVNIGLYGVYRMGKLLARKIQSVAVWPSISSWNPFVPVPTTRSADRHQVTDARQQTQHDIKILKESGRGKQQQLALVETPLNEALRLNKALQSQNANLKAGYNDIESLQQDKRQLQKEVKRLSENYPQQQALIQQLQSENDEYARQNFHLKEILAQTESEMRSVTLSLKQVKSLIKNSTQASAPDIINPQQDLASAKPPPPNLTIKPEQIPLKHNQCKAATLPINQKFELSDIENLKQQNQQLSIELQAYKRTLQKKSALAKELRVNSQRDIAMIERKYHKVFPNLPALSTPLEEDRESIFTESDESVDHRVIAPPAK